MSSDSDDDCYGNIAQRLQSVKNTFAVVQQNKTRDLLDNESTPKTSDTAITVEDYALNNDHAVSIIESDCEEISLDAIIAQNTKQKQKRAKQTADVSEDNIIRGRSKRKRSNTGRTAIPNGSDVESSNNESLIDTSLNNSNALNASSDRPSTRGRGRGRRGRQSNTSQTNSVSNITNNTENSDSNTENTNTDVRTPGRGSRSRGRRARGRRGNSKRARRQWRMPASFDDLHEMLYNDDMYETERQPQYPTYSVGNTYEYPDQCHNQELFSKKPEDVVVLQENDTANDSIDENEELSVKVYWRSSEFKKFNIRRFQKLTQVFNFFAEKENVSLDKLLFTYNDKILRIDDTPDSISYSIAKFIDGGIINQSVSKIVQNDVNNVQKSGLKLKFQCQNVKKPFETVIQAEDKMLLAMTMCAEHFEKPLDKMKFYFDGELISGKSTPKQLELEGGECIDVNIIS